MTDTSITDSTVTDATITDTTVTAATTIKGRVTIFPRAEILDPQGKAIGDALARLGFGQVREVRAGKSFDVVLAGVDPGKAGELLRRMAEKLLANPVVEDFTVELISGETP